MNRKKITEALDLYPSARPIMLGDLVDRVEKIVNEAIDAERESCALICEHAMDTAINHSMKVAYGNMADAIRNR